VHLNDSDDLMGIGVKKDEDGKRGCCRCLKRKKPTPLNKVNKVLAMNLK
jgi:hypothetical protein